MKNILKNKRIIAILCVIIIGIMIFISIICSKFIRQSNEISFDDLIEIVEEEGTNLSWNSFKKYKSEQQQDGLVYVTYDVEGDYILTLSGKSLEKDPWAFTLKNTKTGKYIDIISEDIIVFLGDDY